MPALGVDKNGSGRPSAETSGASPRWSNSSIDPLTESLRDFWEGRWSSKSFAGMSTGSDEFFRFGLDALFFTRFRLLITSVFRLIGLGLP